MENLILRVEGDLSEPRKIELKLGYLQSTDLPDRDIGWIPTSTSSLHVLAMTTSIPKPKSWITKATQQVI